MEYSKKDRNKGGLGKMSFPMVADVSHEIAMKYDCMISDEGDDNGVSLRATFIIDGKGVIRHKSIGDLQRGRNIDEVLRLVQAF
jgi:peroxiredoxin 2/4